MSTEVGVDALWEQAAAFGDRAFLITIGPGGRPHAVSTEVRVGGGRITASPGSTSRANATDRRAVMLLWPPVDDGPYSLLVDGDAEVRPGDTIKVTPTSAVLHRIVGADDELPSCVRLMRAP
ncbi:MAG: hypothetical protein H0W70_08555 [Actinobacteria bacterium]|nr:hypothetical protein [Actinomycetota bacterium]